MSALKRTSVTVSDGISGLKLLLAGKIKILPGPEVIKLFGVHFRARVEFLLQISKIGGHQQNLHISSTILCSTRDSDSKQISDSKTEVIKLFEVVFMLELEYETPNFKLAAYLTSKQTQDGTAQIQRQQRRTARCKNGKIITMNN